MKKGLLVLIVLALFAQVNAQKLVMTPSDSISLTGHVSEFSLGYTEFKLKNLTGDSMIMWWVKDQLSLPTGWSTVISDINNCYYTDSASFVIGANGDSPFCIFFHSFQNEGCSELDLFIYEEGDRPNGVTIYAKACAITTGINVNEALTLKVYPNPVQNTLYITTGNVKDLKQIKVYDMLGLEIRSFNAANVYDVTDLATGRYFVKFIGEDNSVIGTKSFAKVN